MLAPLVRLAPSAHPPHPTASPLKNRGWPKFAARLHKATPDGGVAVTLWAPGASLLALAGGGGAVARLAVDTEYPFGDTAVVTVEAPVGTPVYLRIPGWAASARVCVGGGGGACSAGANGTFFKALQPAPITNFSIDFAPEVYVETYFAGAAAVYRGALLYALALEESVSVINKGPRGFNDYAVNTTAQWNMAVEVDPSSPGGAFTFQRLGGPGAVPFAAPTQALLGKGRAVQGWGLLNNSAAAPPQSPVDCSGGGCGASVDVKLVPYGATLLRVAALPWVLPAA